jgi:hypothetical protein
MPVTFKPTSGPGVPTAADAQRVRRRLDRRRRHVDRVIEALRADAALHLTFVNGRALWSLSSGVFVPADVAELVIDKSGVTPCDGALFPDVPAQTWRFIECMEVTTDE